MLSKIDMAIQSAKASEEAFLNAISSFGADDSRTNDAFRAYAVAEAKAESLTREQAARKAA